MGFTEVYHVYFVAELVYKKHLVTQEGHTMVYGRAYDVAIIGGGIAGLSVALRLPGTLRVALFTKGQLGESKRTIVLNCISRIL